MEMQTCRGDHDTQVQRIEPLIPLTSDPEVSVQAWRDDQEGRTVVGEEKSCCICFPENGPNWWKIIKPHCQCITPGAGQFWCNLFGKMFCLTGGILCSCSRIGIEENSRQNRTRQEVVHSWKTDQAHDLKNLTINLGDMRNQE